MRLQAHDSLVLASFVRSLVPSFERACFGLRSRRAIVLFVLIVRALVALVLVHSR